MERLTKRNADGSVKSAIDCSNGCQYMTCSLEEGIQCKHECEADVYLKLAEYEDLEEQGQLMKLPCKVGDIIYLVKGKKHAEIEELKVIKFVYSNELDIMFLDEIYEVGLMSVKEIGESIFLTKEEAEKKLKEIKEENK